VLISSHRKLLTAKATVVNVAEKSRHDLDRRCERLGVNFPGPTRHEAKSAKFNRTSA
jgi:hypothetical protein